MKVILTNVRGAFLELFEPKVIGNDPKAEPRCSGAFIMDPNTPEGQANMNKVVQAIQTVAAEKWGAKAAEVLEGIKAKGKMCLQPGSTRAEYDGFAGMVFVAANNKARPFVLDRDGKTPISAADGKAYSGAFYNVSIDVWAQDNEWGKRVNAKLLAVQFCRDGEAFSGGASYSQEDFSDLTGGQGVGGGAADSTGFFNPGAAAPAPAPTGFGTNAPSQLDAGFFGAAAPAPAPTSSFF